MPCFSCKCFSDGKGRHGEKLSGGRGYCDLRDQEYWRGHECRDFAPVWYGPKTSGSALREPQNYGFFDLFKRKSKETKPESKKAPSKETAVASFFNTSTHHSTFDVDADKFVNEDFDEHEDALDCIDDSVTHDDILEALDELECMMQNLDDIVSEPAVPQPSKRLLTVQKNIAVDNNVFRKYDIAFKCNLVEEYNTLQLNFELNNTRKLVSKIPLLSATLAWQLP